MFYNFNFLKKLNPEPNDNHEETIEKNDEKYTIPEQFFVGLSFEVNYKNKTIPVKHATIPTSYHQDDEEKTLRFYASLGENSKFSIYNAPVKEYDENLSQVENGKRIVIDYLEDNPDIIPILDKIDDKDTNAYTMETDNAEEAVNTIVAVKKYSVVSVAVSLPVDESFKVVSQLTSNYPHINFELNTAGDKTILVSQ